MNVAMPAIAMNMAIIPIAMPALAAVFIPDAGVVLEDKAADVSAGAVWVAVTVVAVGVDAATALVDVANEDVD
jgi:hypothetical protein